MQIGIDLGGTKTEGVVLDDQGNEQCRLRTPTPVTEGYHAIIDNIVLLINQLEARAGQRCSIGIGTPGARSAVTGRMKNCNTTALNGQPLQDDLQQRLSRPLRIANDANCFALSEALDGAAQGYSMVFGVIMGTGVGGGIVINGRLHQGCQQIAGEWGHNILEVDGPNCYCGQRGCVETLISGPGLAAQYHQQGGRSVLTTKEIVALANQGDLLAEASMQCFFDRFGRAMASVINILDPDAIVLGGGLSNIERLYSEGYERVAHYVFNNEFSTPILKNRHGDSSGVRGAAQLWGLG